MAKACAEVEANGFDPVVLVSRSKVPRDTDWPSKHYRPEDFSESVNLGVKTGVTGNRRQDVDCETVAVAAIAAALFPPTTFIHGRPGLPCSHLWYTVADGPEPEFLSICDEHKKKVIELRWGAGQQTMVPPSIHPNDEQLSWYRAEGVPPTISGPELTRLVRTSGAIEILRRYYPPAGSRHDFALWLSGFLLRQSGCDVARVSEFMRVLASHAKDEEVEDRVRAVETTAANLAADNPATGGGRLRELIGDKVFDAFATALGIIGKSNSAKVRVELPLVESAVVEPDVVDEWPPETQDGDYIADFAHAVTDGTAIPLPYARETTILILGAVCDRLVGFPNHTDLPSRRYACLISDLPQTGKGASWQRTGGITSEGVALQPLLESAGIKVQAGSRLGSGQYLARILQENPQSLAYWDEASSFFRQIGMDFSTLTSALKTLFESNSHWCGSHTNKTWGTDHAHLSVLLHATLPSFQHGFRTIAGVGDGLLSRFTLVYVGNKTVVSEWTPRDFARERHLVNTIEALIPRTLTVPAFEASARECWQKFVLDVAALSEVELTPRVVTMTKIDLLL
ncbi:MAG: bifunctional DNA primase/polymerase, partial [Terriglobales bacterium]